MTIKYRIGRWNVEPSACVLETSDRSVKVTPRAMDVLVHLIEHAGDVVTGENLIQTYWPRTVSSPNVVHKVVAELRHALVVDGDETTYIETVPKRGYRLVAPVEKQHRPATANGDAVNTVATPNAPPENPGHEPSFHRPRMRPLIVAALATMVGIGLALTLVFWVDGRGTASDPGTETPAPVKSLAVLRFRNVDGKPTHDYLAEGIPETLLTTLSRVPGLRVIDRDRAFARSLASEPIEQLATALDAQYVLEGSVHRIGNELRVSVALYETEVADPLFAYARDAPLDQILDLQDEVIADVLSALDIYLNDARRADMRTWGTRNVQAYLAAIEADHIFHSNDVRNFSYAASRLRDAIALDPGFLWAYDHLAQILGGLSLYTDDIEQQRGFRDEIIALRETVTRIDPSSEALKGILFAEARYAEGDFWAQLEAQTRAQIQAAGKPARADYNYVLYADSLISGHLFREAEAFLDVYERFERDNPWVAMRRLALLTFKEGPKRAIAPTLEVVRNFPNDPENYVGLVAQYALIGDFKSADRYVDRIREVDTHGGFASAAALYVSVLRGDYEPGTEAFHAAATNPIHGEFAAGIAYLMVGDVEAGLAIWRQSRPAIREQIYRLTVHAEEYFPKGVVDDPRYQAYLDERGIGRQWTSLLRQKVAELAPITGVEPTDPTPQVVWTR